MTFSLNVEATELQISAGWGQYVKTASEYEKSEQTGNPSRVWKRFTRGGTHRLKLVPGPIKPISLDPSTPDVVVSGLIRKRSDHWCVTLFLVNDQEEPKKLKDTAWIFQPELVAEGADGAAVIHKRHTVVELWVGGSTTPNGTSDADESIKFTINMELGLLITGGKLPAQVEEQFDKLIHVRQLRQL